MAVQSLAYLLDTNILVHYIRRDTLHSSDPLFFSRDWIDPKSSG
jgi:hypothetical protein